AALVPLASSGDHRPSHEAESAQTVQDGTFFEADFTSERGIGVEGIEISRKTVEERLLGRSRFGDVQNRTRVLGKFGGVTLGRPRPVETACIAYDDGPLGFEKQLALVLGLGCEHDLRETLEVVEPFDARDGLEAGGGWDRGV